MKLRTGRNEFKRKILASQKAEAEDLERDHDETLCVTCGIRHVSPDSDQCNRCWNEVHDVTNGEDF